MAAYDEVVKRILENDKADVVEINGVKFPAVRYRGYFVIRTSDGAKIFDGEHIIEPGFRVYDVHLKQYIPYDFPVEKLLSDFGLDPNVSAAFGVPPSWVMGLKGLLAVAKLFFFLVVLYEMYAGEPYYAALALSGGAAFIESLIDAKYFGRGNLFWSVVFLIVVVSALAHLL